MGDSPERSRNQADLELVEGIRRGDVKALSALMDRYKDRAYTLAVRTLGDRSSAEEAVQDAFLKTYHGIVGFRGESAFGTWFYRIVYNCCLTRIRRAPPERITLEEIETGEAVSAEPGPEELLEEQETAGLVNEMLEKLPKQWRSVVTLFYLDELKYEEIAAVMEMPVGTVKTHLFRARARLKKLMHEYASVAEERS